MKKISLFISILSLAVLFQACSRGGEDTPFTYIQPSENIGSGGTGSPAGTGGRAGGTGGTPAGGAGTGGTVTGTGGINPVGTGGSSAPAGTCDALFNATLTLRLDDAMPFDDDPSFRGHYDSPPTCLQYAEAGSSPATMLNPANLDSFLRPPSNNTDLYCCRNIPPQDTDVTGVTLSDFNDSLFCTADDRHGGQPQLAAARWKGDAPMRLRFRISGSTCSVSLDTTRFPNYKIENSALDASLMINAGADYGTFPGAISGRSVNEATITADCTLNADGTISIANLPLRFFVKLYVNKTQNCLVSNIDCDQSSFSQFFSRSGTTPRPNSFQIIPGFGTDSAPINSLSLTTGSRGVDPVVPTLQRRLAVQGIPITFRDGSAKMSLVATYAFPQGGSTATTRNDITGEGQMLAQLKQALLGAELRGTLTKPDGSAITRLSDLSSCSSAPGTGTGGSGTGTGGGNGTQSGTGGSGAGTGGGSGSGGGNTASGVRVEEVSVTDLSVRSVVLPSAIAGVPVINFSDATLGVERQTRIYRIANTTASEIEVNSIQVQDSQKNFRQGPIYIGRTLNDSAWAIAGSSSVRIPAGNNGFFFVTYGPVGSMVTNCGEDTAQPTRCDSASLMIRSSNPAISNATIALRGRATRDTRAVFEMYLQDESILEAFRTAASGFTGMERLNLVKNPAEALMSLRQDERPRALYIKNANGSAAQLDRLVLREMPILAGANADRFGFTPEMGMTFPLSINPGQTVKIGMLTQSAVTATDYQKFLAELRLNIQSVPAGAGAMMGMSGRPPILGGYVSADGRPDRSHTGPAMGALAIRVGRAVNAPSGIMDLRINRLFAGLSAPLVSGTPTLVSSTTKGIATRAGVDVNQYTEVYNLPNGASFDPRAGTMRLNPITTDIQPMGRTRDVTGIRLFDGPGSDPASSYQFQCASNSSASCGYFYLQVGDWSSTSRSCEGRPLISANPIGGNTSAVALPQNITCLRNPTTGLVPIDGVYDPVTGEVSFQNIAIRLFAPSTPGLGNADIDAVLQVGLTTECVKDSYIPDPQARSGRLLNNVAAINPRTVVRYVTDSGFPNPLSQYVGSGCDANELGGRRMGMADMTNTLDNAGDPVGPFTFDLAAVGRIRAGDFNTRSPIDQANGKMMYIIIKAEAIPRR